MFIQKHMDREIVQVVQEFSLDGGVETVAFELAQAWSEAGVPSRVIACRAADERPPVLWEPTWSWLSRVPTRGAWRYFGRLFVVPAFTVGATLAARRYGRDAVVVSHGDCLVGDILVIHALDKISIMEKRRAGQYRWLLNPMHFWVLARDQFLIGGLRHRRYVAVSRRVADELAEAYAVPRDRIVVIPNGINLARFTTSRDRRDAIRAEFGIPRDAQVMLFVGHEFDRKGLRFAIEAMGRMHAKPYLLVVGSDDAEPYRRIADTSGAGKRVIFAGARRDLPALYQAADLYVFPSAYETFSLVCMEALASGVPILATRVGGIEDYLVDGENGFAIRRDADDIARTADVVLCDDALRKRLSAGAAASAQAFGWGSVATQYRFLAAEVARERGLP